MGITRKTGMITLPLSAGADAAKTAASQPHALTNRQTGPTGAKPPLQQHEARDPVCGMTVDRRKDKPRTELSGKTYFFCGNGCKTKFDADPARYLEPARAAAKAEPVVAGAIYTCPMHPQIRQVGPGSCPICGMALEPEIVTLDAGPNHELIDMTRRFWIGLALSVPVLIIEMGGHLSGLKMLIGSQFSNWVQLALATPVVLWAGWPFFERAFASLKTRNLNMFTLIAMGTGVAYVYSVVATVAPGRFPPAGAPWRSGLRGWRPAVHRAWRRCVAGCAGRNPCPPG